MVKFLYIVTIFAALYGGAELVIGLSLAESAPQQAAIAAMSIAYAVIPYCVARAASEIKQDKAPGSASSQTKSNS